jgi:hypothetical protein
VKAHSQRCLALGAAAVIALLAGCAVGSTSPSPVGGPSLVASLAPEVMARYESRAAVPNVLPPGLQYLVRTGQELKRPSWVKPDAKTTPQWFVSDINTGTVTCFDLAGNVLGQITGLKNPQGMAIHFGKLYVAVTGASTINEYNVNNTCNSHVVKTLSDPGQFPGDVAVGKGIVYVSNINSASSGPGSISYYLGSSSTPSGNFSGGGVPSQDWSHYFIALDSSGNLYSSYTDWDGHGLVECFPAPATSGPGFDQGLVLGAPVSIAFAKNGNLIATDELQAYIYPSRVNTYAGGSCASGGWTLLSTISSAQNVRWPDIALRPANGLLGVTANVQGSPSSPTGLVILEYPSGKVFKTFTAPGQSLLVGIATTGNSHN